MIGLEESTQMDKNGHVAIQEEALEGFRVQIKKYGTYQACPHSRWTWKGHIGSNNKKHR